VRCWFWASRSALYFAFRDERVTQSPGSEGDFNRLNQ